MLKLVSRYPWVSGKSPWPSVELATFQVDVGHRANRQPPGSVTKQKGGPSLGDSSDQCSLPPPAGRSGMAPFLRWLPMQAGLPLLASQTLTPGRHFHESIPFLCPYLWIRSLLVPIAHPSKTLGLLTFIPAVPDSAWDFPLPLNLTSLHRPHFLG